MEKNAPTQQDRWPSVNVKVCQFEPCGKKKMKMKMMVVVKIVV